MGCAASASVRAARDSQLGQLRTLLADEVRRGDFDEGDARDVDLLAKLLADYDHFIAGAAMIGGISYFHAFAGDC